MKLLLPTQSCPDHLSFTAPPPPRAIPPRKRMCPQTPLPGAGCVLASLQPCTELSAGVQQVEVVAADKVLSKPDDGGLQAGLAVVVGRVLRHITSQLSNLWDRSVVGGGGGVSNNGGLYACFAMVVGRVVRHVTSQLGNLCGSGRGAVWGKGGSMMV